MNSYMGTLQGAGFFPRVCKPEEYIRLMRELLNRETPENVSYNPSKELREHFVNPNTKFAVQENGDIYINNKPHRVYSVKDYPPEVALFDFGELMGSFTDNMKQIPTPFAICMNMKLPNVLKQKERFTMKSHWTTQQADGNPVAKYMPALWKRYKNFQVGLEMYDQGKVQTPMQLSLWVQGDDEQHLEYLGQFLRTLWMQKNFTLKEEGGDETAFPAFLSTLPLQYDHFYENFLKRSEPLFSCNAANMSPITSDWKGSGSPFMTLVSRRGQLMSFDPYTSNGNYNICVVAESGKGKSVFTNEMVCSVLAEGGGKVFIIDIGRSYEKLCEQIGGEFIEFDPSIVINPFTKIKVAEDGNIEPEEYELLIPLAGNMIGMNFKATQDEKDPSKKRLAGGCIERAIAVTFKEFNHDTCWGGHIINQLKKQGDQLSIEISEAMYKFSFEGSYSKYVNGTDTFEYTKDLVCLELDSLEQKEDLKSLFLMMMLYRVSQDIFLGYDRKKMVVLDEAWSLMRDNLTSSFIEKAFRRFRKHFAAACVITQTIMDFFYQ